MSQFELKTLSMKQSTCKDKVQVKAPPPLSFRQFKNLISVNYLIIAQSSVNRISHYLVNK